MKQLVCEICNGTSFVKEVGSFVCQSCGMKYSSEEAKKIINGTNAPTEIKKEIQVKVENAIREFNSNNLKQAYAMLSDVLNIEPENTDAIIYKALALGWQATLSDPKIAIVMNEYIRAFKIIRANSSGTYEFTQKILHPLKLYGEMADAAFQAHYNYLQKEGARANNHLQSEGERGRTVASWSYSDGKKIIDNAQNFANKIIADAGKIFKSGNDNIIKCMGGVVVEILGIIGKDYDNICEDFIPQIKHYLALMQRRCKNGDVSNDAMSFANQVGEVILQIENTIDSAWEKALEEENEKYWKENPEKQAKLKRDAEELEKKISEQYTIQWEIEDKLSKLEKDNENEKTPHEAEAEKTENEIKDLENEKNSLGFFKFKDKKALTLKIEKKEAMLIEILVEAEKERAEKNKLLENEKKKIQKEYNKLDKVIEELNKQKEDIDNMLDNGLARKKAERKNMRDNLAVEYWVTMGLSRKNAESYVSLMGNSLFKF